ncbi:MAG: hypothetical protein WAM11_13685 [Cyanobium sp.]
MDWLPENQLVFFRLDLATLKAQAAAQQAPELDISADPQAMPSRNLPTDTAGTPRGSAQRNPAAQKPAAPPTQTVPSSRAGMIGSRATTARLLSMAITR